MYTYKIYGLIIKSDIIMKEVEVINEYDKVDVTIACGFAPKKIDNANYEEEHIKFSKNEFYLYIVRVAHYYVANGNEIIVELEEKCNMEDVKIFLLGTCLGVLLAQRNTIAIHGGAVVDNGQGIIITGHTGAGKSTLATALRIEGYSFLADDVSALEIDSEGEVMIYPTYPQQKLCKDAMEKMGYNINNFSMIDQEREKYAIPLKMNFLSNSVPLKNIYEINIVDEDNVSIEELYGNEKVLAVLRNIYRIEILSRTGFEPKYFKKCVEIAKSIQVFRIRRPKDKFSVNSQIELIKKTLST